MMYNEKCRKEIYKNNKYLMCKLLYDSQKAKAMLNINIIDLPTKTELVSSKSEAKNLIQQNGISLNKQKVTDENRMVTNEDLDNKSLILKKGKKVYLRVMFD